MKNIQERETTDEVKQEEEKEGKGTMLLKEW
jgi:hypothetical protein